MNIFSENAQKYWDAGLQVMPLKANTKSPVIHEWQKLASEAVTAEEKTSWPVTYPDGNLGLPAGPASGVCFIDIDCFDERLTKEFEEALPASPWRRVGQKGCVKAYKWSQIKNFNIRSSDKSVGVEFIGAGRQIVLPPSIHPDTGRAYVSDTNLYDVLNELVPLPEDLKDRVLKVFERNGLKVSSVDRVTMTGKVSAGVRDDTMIRLAGMYAQDIRRGLKPLKTALEEMWVWGQNFVDDMDSDPINIQKGQQRIVEWLISDVKKRNCVLPKGWDAEITPEDKKEWGLDILDEQYKSMDYEDMRKLVDSLVIDASSDLDKMNGVETVLRHAARSEDLNDISLEALFKTLRTATNNKVTISTLKKVFNKYKLPPLAGKSHSEIAKCILEDWAEFDLRFDHDKLWEWYGSHWKEKTEQDVVKYVADLYGELPASHKWTDYVAIHKTICSLTYKKLKQTDFVGVNFTNGVLGEDLFLRPHNKDYGMIYEMPYAWKPDCPQPTRWLNFLNTCFNNDQESVEALREFLAVSLFGIGSKFQQAFLLYGKPHCGKSVILKVITAMFPQEARCALAPDQWGESFMTVSLDGPLINIAGDIVDEKPIPAQTFQQVIDGSVLTSRAIRGKPYDFVASPSHIFATNKALLTKNVSEAFMRRFNVLSFRNPVPKDKVDLDLDTKIISEELEQIVNWAIPAIKTARDRGHYLEPKRSRGDVQSMRTRLNPARGWVAEKLILKDGAVLKEDAAYNSFRNWMALRGERRMDVNSFRTSMNEVSDTAGFVCEIGLDGTQTYYGAEIKPT